MLFFFGLGIGLLNGFFGSGGGILAVALFEKQGLEVKKAHATSIAVVLPLSIISLVIYWFHGNLLLQESLPFFIPVLLGSLLGAWGLNKFSAPILKLIFSILILYSSIKILWS